MFRRTSAEGFPHKERPTAPKNNDLGLSTDEESWFDKPVKDVGTLTHDFMTRGTEVGGSYTPGELEDPSAPEQHPDATAANETDESEEPLRKAA